MLDSSTASNAHINYNPEPKEVFTRTMYHSESNRNSLSVVSINPNRQFDQSLDQNGIVAHFQQYKPLSTFSLEALAESSNTTHRKYKDCIYYGEIVNDKRQGRGVLLYANGRAYEGEWQNDSKHGKGFQRYSNASTYEGSFSNNRPEGVGTYIWPNGEMYEGQWVNGLKHGSGMWKGSRGDSYIGQWKFGKADGYGVHTWINGDRYEGQFRSCLKHGQGTEKFANGDSYSGSYENGKPSGYGEYFWSNGSFFKGYFKNGLRHGNGVWKRGSGAADKYEGEYANDKKCGYGVFTWQAGNIYKGHYFDDSRHGFGEMYWSDGSWFKGQWQKGIQHGQGQIFIPPGPVRRGVFENNVLISQVHGNPNNETSRQKSKTQIASGVIPHNRGLNTAGTQISFEPAGFKKPRELDKLDAMKPRQSNAFSNPHPPNQLNDSRVLSEYSYYSGHSNSLANRMIRRPQYPSPSNKPQSVSSKNNTRSRTLIDEIQPIQQKIPHSSYYLKMISKNYDADKAKHSIRKRIVINSHSNSKQHSQMNTIERAGNFKRKSNNRTVKTIPAKPISYARVRRVSTGLNKTEIAEQVANFTRNRIGAQNVLSPYRIK